MSVVFVVFPVVAGGWPFVSAAMLGAAGVLGYRAVRAEENRLLETGVQPAEARSRSVSLRMEQSQVMADALARGETLVVEREGLRATFSRDGRGCCTLHMEGEGRSEAELQAAGRELMDRVRQQFAYAKVMEELEARGFDVVQEQLEATGAIRVRVRRWA
jgi:hypothetical protein